MNSEELKALIAERLAAFYRRRMQRLQTLKLNEVLKRKNPYLFKAVGTKSAPEVVEGILSAYLSSSDEGIFGDEFFEPIAKAVSGGVVSPSEGVDIAVETDTVYKAVAVKSGPNPFNSSQRKRQDDEFRSLKRRLQKLGKQFDPILGHAYGRQKPEPEKSNVIYRDLAGQAFWEELTGDPDFYLKLIRFMEDEVVAKHRHEYEDAWKAAVNKYLGEFIPAFCNKAGNIDWEKLTRFNSGKAKTPEEPGAGKDALLKRRFSYSFTRYYGELSDHFHTDVYAKNIKDALLYVVADLKSINAETEEEAKAHAKLFIDEKLGKKRWTIKEFLLAGVELWPDFSTLYIVSDITEMKPPK
jgi:hypothetical protein